MAFLFSIHLNLNSWTLRQSQQTWKSISNGLDARCKKLLTEGTKGLCSPIMSLQWVIIKNKV